MRTGHTEQTRLRTQERGSMVWKVRVANVDVADDGARWEGRAEVSGWGRARVCWR